MPETKFVSETSVIPGGKDHLMHNSIGVLELVSTAAALCVTVVGIHAALCSFEKNRLLKNVRPMKECPYSCVHLDKGKHLVLHKKQYFQFGSRPHKRCNSHFDLLHMQMWLT